MLKQAFVVACAIVGIAGAGLVAAQAQSQSKIQQQAQGQSCQDKCHTQFQNCTPASSKNLDACRATWQACDAACPKK